ncbi:MAG: glycosyltransferase family 2 protein [Candidatus Thorarchaeota archaeon]
MLVSVIMPVFNSIEFLRESIESILNQTFKDLEFIILDDGSTEPVWDLIQSYDDPRIVRIRNPENIGLTKSLNICLDKVRGDFVARHDSDDISLPSRIEEQLKLFEENVGFVTCWYDELVKKDGVWQVRTYKGDRIVTSQLLSEYTKKNCGNDAGTIYSIEAVRKVGYFDERLFLGQTYNYNRRIQQFFEGRVVPKVLYLRREWGNRVGKRVKRFEFGYEGIDWHDLCNRYAKSKPIITERQVYSWEG